MIRALLATVAGTKPRLRGGRDVQQMKTRLSIVVAAEKLVQRQLTILAAFEALPSPFDLVSPGRTPLRIPTSGDDLLGEQLSISVRQLHHGVSYFFQ
jgi:hypothetical protein